MNWIFKNFSPNEFSCQHCGENGIDMELVEKLQKLRDLYKKPITISSGYRCKDHPIEIKKDIPGTHTEGRAVDIAVDRAEAYKILGLAFKLEFTGIGVKQKGHERFLHLDISKQREPRPTVWSY